MYNWPGKYFDRNASENFCVIQKGGGIDYFIFFCSKSLVIALHWQRHTYQRWNVMLKRHCSVGNVFGKFVAISKAFYSHEHTIFIHSGSSWDRNGIQVESTNADGEVDETRQSRRKVNVRSLHEFREWHHVRHIFSIRRSCSRFSASNDENQVNVNATRNWLKWWECTCERQQVSKRNQGFIACLLNKRDSI